MTVTTIASDGVLPPPIANPFVGPRAFEYGEILFGRSEELREIGDLLIAQRILLLYSPSGAGKSSLLEAALRPELESRSFRVLPTVRIGQGAPPTLAGMPVRNRYVLSTLLSLERGKPTSEQFEKERLVTADLSEYLATLGGTPGGDPVLFFDQFEELFTLDSTDVEQKLAFVEELGEALRNRGRWALFAMREEFVAQLDPYVDLLPTLLRTRYRLDLLTASAAIDAIREPARRAGVEISQDAARRLVDDLRSVKVQRGGATTKELGPYVEPVQLQVVCRQLWARPRSTMWSIELPDVLALGEIDRPLAEYYAEQVRDAAAGSQVSEREIRDWFEHTLIAPGGYRMQTIDGPDGGVGGSAIDALLRAHLVRGEDRRGATWYELAHDRLVEPVLRSNAEWREGNLSMLQQAAATWADADRRDGLLISSADVLKDAEAWVKEHPDEVSSVDDDYLKASRRQWQQARRSRHLSYVLAGVGVLAILCLAIALVLWRTAVVSKNRAVGFERSARWLGDASMAAPDDGRMTALSWINATRVFPRSISAAPNQFRPLADSALHFLAHDPYDGGVFAFRSDGQDVVEAGADGRVNVVHLDDGTRRQLMLADEPITDMDFDQSGPRLSVIVQVGAASELQRWDVDTATLLGQVKIPAAHAFGPGVSADGQTVAVYTDDTVKDQKSAVAELIILDAQSSAVGYRSGPHMTLDARPAVAPDGEQVAVVGDDLCLHVVTRLQDTWSDKKIDELCGLTDYAALTFDPTGARVAVGRADGTLDILALGDGSITSVPGDGDVITDVAFLPDGSLHTLTRGGSIETWRAEADTFTNVISARQAGPAGYAGRLTTDARRAVVWGDNGLVVFDSVTGREMTSEQLLGPREADVADVGHVKIDWGGEAVMDDWDGREFWRTPPTIGTVRSVAVGRSFGLPGSVVVISTDSSIVVLDAGDGTKRYELPLAQRPPLPDAERSDNDGPTIGNGAPALDQIAASGDAEVVVAAIGNVLTIWDPVNENVRQPTLPAGARITSIATSWDGSTVAAGLVTGARSEIWVWKGNDEARKFVVQSEATALDVNIGLLAGTSDGNLWWWDLTTTDPPPRPLTLHVDGPVVDLDWLVPSDKRTDVVVATPRTVSVFDVDRSFDVPPPDPIRQIELFGTEGDFLGVASDDSRLLMVEADGFSYAMDHADEQLDLDQARNDAERLRERTGMRMTPIECNDDPKLPCPAA